MAVGCGRLIRLEEVKQHLGDTSQVLAALHKDTARKKLPASTTQNRCLLLRLLPVFYNSSLKGEGNMMFLLKGFLVN